MTRQRFACFDLFDTVLLRRVSDPTDIFRRVYRRLYAHQPAILADIDEAAFVSIRLLAEQRARAGVEETTLCEIWDEIAKEIGEFADIGREIELNAERESLYPNEDICRRIRELRGHGKRIVYISDMYLPADFLREVLIELDIYRPTDELFVSSEYLTTKSQGGLYSLVIETLGGSPSDYQMFGDNRHSDVRRPKKLGMKAVHYRGHRFSEYEQRVARAFGQRRLDQATLVGALREGRKGPANFEGYQRLVSDFLGPASLLWALWAIRRAEESDLERVNFMARDAYLAHLCGESLQMQKLTKINCNYFYGSRYSFYFANIRNIQTDLDWIPTQTDNLTIRKILRYLHLQSGSLSQALEDHVSGVGLDEKLTTDEFIIFKDKIANSPEAHHILNEAKAARGAAERYLDQEGINQADITSAFVDLGWHLNVQSAIQRLVPQKKIRGLYVYISENRRMPSEVGAAEAMLDVCVARRSTAQIPFVWQTTTVAEHLFGMAPHGTCLGFETDEAGVVRPLLQEMPKNEVEMKTKISNHVQAYAADWARIFSETFTTSDACARAFRALTDAYFRLPTRESLRCLNNAFHLSSDLQNDESRPIAAGIELQDLGHLIALAAGGRRGNRFGWPTAKLSLLPPPFRYSAHIFNAVRPYLYGLLDRGR